MIHEFSRTQRTRLDELISMIMSAGKESGEQNRLIKLYIDLGDRVLESCPLCIQDINKRKEVQFKHLKTFLNRGKCKENTDKGKCITLLIFQLVQKNVYLQFQFLVLLSLATADGGGQPGKKNAHAKEPADQLRFKSIRTEEIVQNQITKTMTNQPQTRRKD